MDAGRETASGAGGATGGVSPAPHRIQIAGLILVSVDGTAAEWGLTTGQFQGLLETLGVPQVQLTEGGRSYVSVYPLEYSLFALGLPKAMRPNTDKKAGHDPTVMDVHYQMAGLLYGTLTREAVRERVRALAGAVGQDLKMAPKRGRVARDGFRKTFDTSKETPYNTTGE